MSIDNEKIIAGLIQDTDVQNLANKFNISAEDIANFILTKKQGNTLTKPVKNVSKQTDTVIETNEVDYKKIFPYWNCCTREEQAKIKTWFNLTETDQIHGESINKDLRFFFKEGFTIRKEFNSNVEQSNKIPWEALIPYHKEFFTAHHQTLKTLLNRGGLGAHEIYKIITGKEIEMGKSKEPAVIWIEQFIKDFKSGKHKRKSIKK